MFIKMATASSWAHVSQSWWNWWGLVIVLLWVCTLYCIMRWESMLLSFMLWMVRRKLFLLFKLPFDSPRSISTILMFSTIQILYARPLACTWTLSLSFFLVKKLLSHLLVFLIFVKSFLSWHCITQHQHR